MYKYQNKQLRRKITKEAMDQARRGEKRVLKSDRVIRYHIGDADKYTDKEEEEDSDVDSDDEKSEETDYESEVEEKSATKEVVLPQNIKDKTDKWLTSTFNAKEVFAQDRAQKEAKLALDVRSSYMRTLAKMGLQEHEMKQYAQLIQNKHKKMLEIEGAARAQLVGGSALALIEGKPSRKKKKAQEQEKKEFNEMKHERVTVDTLRQDHFEDLGKNRLRWARKIGDALKETLVYDNTNHALRDVEIKYVEMNESLRVASVKWEPNSITEWKFEQYERVNKLLNQAAGFLASRVAARTKVRNAPKFEFYYDLEPEAASEYIVQAADPNSGHAQYEQLNALLKRLGAKQDKEEDAQVEEWIFRTYEMGDDQKEMSRKVSIEERNRRIEQSQKQKVINRRKRRSKAK
jgi:ribosome-binding factor A